MGQGLESALAVNFLYDVLLKKAELNLTPKHSRERTHILMFFVGRNAKELYLIRNIKSTRILLEHPLTVDLPGVRADPSADPYQGGTVKNAAMGRRISANRQHTVYAESTEALERLMDWYADSDSADSIGNGIEDNSAIPEPIPSARMTDLVHTEVGEVLTTRMADIPLPTSTISALQQNKVDFDTQSLNTDEREAVVKVRYGQGAYRDALLNLGEDKCWMSGIQGKRLLIASHIKPWSHCEGDTDSRGRTDNGLLLSALWDSAFDSGLISFDPDFGLVTSSELSDSAKDALALSRPLSLPKKFRTNGRREYLAYHRAEVFEHWKKSTVLRKARI